MTALLLTEIRAGDNDRKAFDPADLADLAASIEAAGELHFPILVRPVDPGLDGVRYEIVAGERRFRAHQLLGWATIDANVVEKTDEDTSMAMLVENVQRVDLNPVEEAWAYHERIEQFGLDVDTLAARIGRKPAMIRARLKLLDLAPDILELARVGQLGPEKAGQLARLDHNRQIIAVRTWRRTPNMAWDDFMVMCRELENQQNQDTLPLDGDGLLILDEFMAHRPDKVRRLSRAQLVALIEKMAPSVWSVDRELGDEAYAAVEAESGKVAA
jgi:ParB/RepB/Spo0J family partition protein